MSVVLQMCTCWVLLVLAFQLIILLMVFVNNCLIICNLARSANLPEGLSILLALISFFFFF